jgi:surface polysaccharide O-acyltransferase-like enzyme
MDRTVETHLSEPRNQGLDLLRIFAMIAVVVIHAAAPYILGNKPLDGSYITAITFDSFARFCVPVFVMISGALMLTVNEDIDKNPWQYYGKKVLRFLPPIIFWSVFYWGFSGKIGYILQSSSLEIAFNEIKHTLIREIPYYHMWYLFMMPGLFFMAPMFRFLKRKSTPKQWIALGIGLLIFGMLHNAWRQQVSSWAWYYAEFVDFLGYLILGDIIFNRKFPKAVSLFSYIGGSIALSVATYFFTQSYVASFLSILIAIPTIGLYAFLTSDKSTKDSKIVYDIALSSFGIYLVHPFIVDSIMRATNFSLTGHTGINIVVYTTITLILSYILVKVIRVIPILKRVV